MISVVLFGPLGEGRVAPGQDRSIDSDSAPADQKTAAPSNPFDRKWYVYINKKTCGPFSGHDIRWAVENGRIADLDLTCPENGQAWGPAKDDPILRTLFKKDASKASHGIGSRSRIRVAVISFLALAGIVWLAWPYYALYDLWFAVREGDTARLENRIAWESLREGLRGDLNALFLQKMRAEKGAGNGDLGTGLAMVLAPTIINQLIDGYLTPQAVGNLIRTGKPQPIGTETNRDKGSLDSDRSHQFSLKQIRYAFFAGGPLTFKVEVVPPETDQTVQGTLTLLFRWNGDWRLTRVIIPTDTGDTFQQSLSTSAGASKSAKAATPSKATEPAPLQVTLVKMGFKNANYKAFDYDEELTFVLSIQNLTDRDVRAFDGVLTFTDLLDNFIMSSKLAINDAVRAGSTLNWDGRIKYNQFIESHKRLRAEQQANLKISFAPRKVLFADGTSKEYSN